MNVEHASENSSTGTRNPSMSLATNTAELSGTQKAAVLMLAIGEDRATHLFGHMRKKELQDLSQAMAGLGDVPEAAVDALVQEFSTHLAGEIRTVRPADASNAYLLQTLNAEGANAVVDPLARTIDVWERLNAIQPNALAAFVRNEHPQTAAVVLSRLAPQHAARVISELPNDISSEMLNRMLDSTAVRPEVLDGLEQTLRDEFVDVRDAASQADGHRKVAEILDNLDGQSKNGLLAVLAGHDQTTARQIRSHMYRFENLAELPSHHLQALVGQVELDVLACALKGSGDDVRSAFLQNMPDRQRKRLSELAAELGPTRLREIDAAQSDIIAIAKDLVEKNVIVNNRDRGRAQLVA